MSQAGDVDITGTHPEIATNFVTDSGTAVPILNTLEILGTYVAAGTTPVETTGSGNTVTIEVQTSQAIAASDVTKIGLSNFSSAAFSVDANGFVTLNGGGGAATNIDVDAHTAPGTDPVVPSMGNIVMTGAQVASGVVGANVIRTDSLAANTVTIEIQRSAAVAATDSTKNGVAHFDSGAFAVDANGFVTLAGGGLAIDSIGTQTGTNPIAPTAAGLVTINGAVVAAGTNPVRSDGTGANTMALEVQISQAIAATDATKVGLCNFDSASFAVDANGFVTLAGGTEAIDSIGVDATSGGGTNPVLPTAGGLVTVNGAAVAAGTNPVRSVSTAANVYQIQVQTAQAIATQDTTKLGLANFNNVYFTVTNGFVTPIYIPFRWDNGSGTFNAVVNRGYFITGTSTVTLPASPVQGDVVRFFVDTSSILTIIGSGAQVMQFANTLINAGGLIVSSQQGDAIEFVYRSSDTKWCVVNNPTGAWNLTP